MKQFQVHNFYKISELTNKMLYYFGKIEENMDLSLIHLAVHSGTPVSYTLMYHQPQLLR